MKLRLLIFVGFLCLGGPLAKADDPVYSGPQPGETLTPFRVRAFSGPGAGEEVEWPAPTRGEPTVLVFVHEITRPALQLIRPIDHFGAKWAEFGLATRVVWLAADPAEAEAFLARAKDSLRLKSPVVIALDGAEGPGNYGLNRKVTVTILVAQGDKVAANFAIVQPNETDAPKVLAEVAKLVGRPAPTLKDIQSEIGQGRTMGRPETPRAAAPRGTSSPPDISGRIAALEAQVAALTEALDEARARIAKLEGAPPPAPIQARPPAQDGDHSRNPELKGLMRRLIRPMAEAEEVRGIAEEMDRWAGDDPRKKAELARYGKLVLGLGYGTEAAKDALKRLAGD